MYVGENRRKITKKLAGEEVLSFDKVDNHAHNTKYGGDNPKPHDDFWFRPAQGLKMVVDRSG
jgi:hypothetical protein